MGKGKAAGKGAPPRAVIVWRRGWPAAPTHVRCWLRRADAGEDVCPQLRLSLCNRSDPQTQHTEHAGPHLQVPVVIRSCIAAAPGPFDRAASVASSWNKPAWRSIASGPRPGLGGGAAGRAAQCRAQL